MAARLKICVYGAGAIGGSIAVRLSCTTADVSVVARGAHGRAIQQAGLTLVAGHERRTVQLACAETPDSLPRQEIVIVAVKGPQLAAIAEPLTSLLLPDTRVVFAMNGIPWWFGDTLPHPVATCTATSWCGRPCCMDIEAGRQPELDTGILALSAIAAAEGFGVPTINTLA